MTLLQRAQRLASFGFRVFPLQPDGKFPAVTEFPQVATSDPKQVEVFWKCPVLEIEQPFNIGISTDGLLVVDVDVTNGKAGMQSLEAWDILGFELPKTFEQITASGGRHLVFKTNLRVGNSVQKIAAGIDVRGVGGYIVGAGSRIGADMYSANWSEIADAPGWLVKMCLAEEARQPLSKTDLKADQKLAFDRAIDYLSRAPKAIEHEGANQTTYQVAAKLKDLGLDQSMCVALMCEDWNDKNPNPWPIEKLESIVDNAYRYGKNPQGVLSPEADFEAIPETPAPLDAIEELNKEFAFVLAGGGYHILRETDDSEGRPVVEHLQELAFHKRFCSKTKRVGDKSVALTKLWMNSLNRRTYDGFVFRPGLPTPDRFYNLFRGFAVKPADDSSQFPESAHVGFKNYLEHTLRNICDGDTSLFDWLVKYLAHMVQRPWEKPHTALVLKGRKGVGKNVFIEQFGNLLGGHALYTAEPRYVGGQFNGHLERLLLFVLDEAVWAGDKKMNSVLKNLITGKQHVIEHKGQEPYVVDNLLRMVIMGNDKWLVPASEDERRYAVFNVAEHHQKNTKFFKSIVDGMKAGGNQLLLQYLMGIDISDFDINTAPITKGLLEQKLESGDPIDQWWYECLNQAELLGSEFTDDWPESLARDGLRKAMISYSKEKNIRSRHEGEVWFSRHMRLVCPSAKIVRAVKEGSRGRFFQLPDIAEARKDFEAYIGHEMEWDT